MLSASGFQLVAWQAHVLHCHGPSSTGEVPNQSPVPKGLCCPELLCMCWKCSEQIGLHPLRRQSHNSCLEMKALSSSGHLDACPDEQALSNEMPGKDLLHKARMAWERAKPVPLLTPTSKSFGGLCAHLLLLLLFSLWFYSVNSPLRCRSPCKAASEPQVTSIHDVPQPHQQDGCPPQSCW